MGISKLCCHNRSESGLNSRTPFFQRFACGVGHVMNEITRQLLLSFRLVIFMQVFGLSATNAGWLMLYGLISVAASSAIGALLIDNVKIPYLSKTLGKRKAWPFIGRELDGFYGNIWNITWTISLARTNARLFSFKFQVLTLILIGISLLFAVIFHVGTKEPSEERVGKLSKNEPVRFGKYLFHQDHP